MIRKKWSLNEHIIDLSNKENNHLERFQLNFFEDISNDDLNVVDTLLDIDNLKTCDFYLGDLEKISKSLFTNFVKVENLKIRFRSYRPNEIESKLFSNFNNLKSLSILIFEQDLKIILDGIQKLDELKIQLKFDYYTKSDSLNEDTFKNIQKLRRLYFESFPISLIEKSFCTDLENLKVLFIEKSVLSPIPNDIFSHLLNLNCLILNGNSKEPIDLQCLNVLSNLELLCLSAYISSFENDTISQNQSDVVWLNMEKLNLPKLRYLSINSKKVPKLKNFK